MSGLFISLASIAGLPLCGRAMKNNPPPTRYQRIRKQALWLLADMLNASSRLAFRFARVLSDASDSLVMHEYATREKTIRD